MDGRELLIAAAIALTVYAGQQTVKGIEKVAHAGKKAGAAIVHVLKKPF